jgi:hypothetical protein
MAVDLGVYKKYENRNILVFQSKFGFSSALVPEHT